MTKSMYDFYLSVKSILTGSYDSIHQEVSFVEIQKGSNEGWFINATDSNKKDIFFVRVNTGSLNDAIKVLTDISKACLA